MMEIDGGKPKSHQFIMKSLWLLALLPLSACADETISGYADTGATYRLTHIGEAIFTADATITFLSVTAASLPPAFLLAVSAAFSSFT